MNEQGKKHDQDKTRFDLIDPQFEDDLARVLTMGAKKYGANNWKYVDNAINRYIAAMRRHLSAYCLGEFTDPESGLPHMSHVACNAMFIHYLTREVPIENTYIQSDENRRITCNDELRKLLIAGLFNDHEEKNRSLLNDRETGHVLDKLRTYLGSRAYDMHFTGDGSLSFISGTNNETSYNVSYISESTLSELQQLADRYLSESNTGSDTSYDKEL